MGVFSDTQIKAAVKSGQIVIHPYIEENVRGSSVDMTLGEWFFRTGKIENRDFYNPFDPDDVIRYFGEPLRAMPHEQWCEQFGRKLFKGISEEHPIIVLRPGERILAHTNEFIGINAPGTTEVRARSSWGRNGVAVCIDAGWGDPGYINRWTLEVYNLNQHESVPLPVGERIAQMVFHETGPVEHGYADGGKYQSSADLGELVKSWAPEQMRPKAFKDERNFPLPL